MDLRFCCRRVAVISTIAVASMLVGVLPVRAQSSTAKATFDVYGFAMLDMGYDFKQIDPEWFDVMRPTKLPAEQDEWGKDGRFYSGVRQSRLGFKALVPTKVGDLKTIFEFERNETHAD